MELPALGVQIQMAELPLVERFHSSLRWKNGVEIVAVPLHPRYWLCSIVTRCFSRRTPMNFITVFLDIPVAAAMVL